MELREIEKLIKSYINQSLEGHSTENSKFDFKRQWYNLNDLGGINEFLKDTTAIANTFGPDGFIVIGFDEKDRSFSNSQFKDCGLRDQADIINLINKKIDRLFDINIYTLKLENHNLSVINIPPSIDKPHVIRNYITINNKGEQKTEVNKVFVKKGTTTQTAGKNDYELMYYDRKNIISEYKLFASYSNKLFTIKKVDDKIEFDVYLTIENQGLRSVAINEIRMYFDYYPDIPTIDKYLFISKFKGKNIIITPGSIYNDRICFWGGKQIIRADPDHEVGELTNELMFGNIYHDPLQILLQNGKVLTCEIFMNKI